MSHEKNLVGVEMHAYLSSSDIKALISKLVSVMKDLGFILSRRAEGYAFLPMGMPVPTHLRLGVYSEVVTFWVRGAGTEDIERSANQLNMKREKFFEILMRGIERSAEIFNSFQDKGSVRVHVSSE